jgi:DNA-directed RNA polymerase specialized sigma24 family protein
VADVSFVAFYQASHSRLLRQVYAVTTDLGEAEDVLQEAFARAAMRWSTLNWTWPAGALSSLGLISVVTSAK